VSCGRLDEIFLHFLIFGLYDYSDINLVLIKLNMVENVDTGVKNAD
jgi:hypothetical protein